MNNVINGIDGGRIGLLITKWGIFLDEWGSVGKSG